MGTYWGHMGIMEKKMKKLHYNRVYIGVVVGNKWIYFIGILWGLYFFTPY